MIFRHRRMQVFSGYKIRGTVPALRQQITAFFPVCRLLLRGLSEMPTTMPVPRFSRAQIIPPKHPRPGAHEGHRGASYKRQKPGTASASCILCRGDLFYVTPPRRVTGNSEPCICAMRRPVLRFTAPSVRFSLSRQVNRGGIGRSAKQRRALSGLHFRVVGLHSPIITHPAGMRVQNCNGNQIIRRSRSLRTEYRQSGRQYRRMLRHRRRGTQRFPRRFHPARI